MHEGLWERVVRLDAVDTARRAKCECMPGTGHYEIVLLGQRFIVDPAKRTILPVSSAQQLQKAGFLEHLCILAYLISARDVPPANKLVGAEALESGTFFFRGLHTLPVDKLIETFGDNPALLYKAGEQLGAERQNYGDASIELSVLPRFGLTLVVWGSDAEFGARASILFDQTANLQLPLDAIGAAVEIAVKAVISSVNNSN